MFYAVGCLAIASLVRRSLRSFAPSLWLDGLAGGLTLGAVCAAFAVPETADLVHAGCDFVLAGMIMVAIAGRRLAAPRRADTLVVPGACGAIALAVLVGAQAVERRNRRSCSRSSRCRSCSCGAR